MLNHARGVTLIELMIVIAVIALLAGIAIPSYRRYLLRSQRSEAKIALLALQTAEEKYYLQYNAYSNNVTGATDGTGLGLTATSETGKYDVSVPTLAADGQSYTATAVPRTGGGQTDDVQCKTFSITDRGIRGVTGPEGPEYCWK
jgi:type IV pilus assembly protein PilE